MTRISTNGIALDVHIHGEGRPVLLLHGWPDDHTVWDGQVEALVAAGYRVIRPDLRGCGGSDRPTEIADYRAGELLRDIVGLVDALELDRPHVIGHDWGAALTWPLVARTPHLFSSATCLSVGHPSALAGGGIEQLQRSWYMLFFQEPGVAEQWLSADDFANFRDFTRHPDIERTVTRLAQPGHLTAGLNLYRANRTAAQMIAPVTLPPVTVPMMGVWSSRDLAVLEPQMVRSAEFVTGPWRYERLDGVGHWMSVEAPDRVNALLLGFLGSVEG